MTSDSLANSPEAWRAMIRRAREDSFFMGYVLEEYQTAHTLDDEQLARKLECAREQLERLALCRRPDDESDRFKQDVEQIANLVSCNSDRLVQLLREVGAVASLRIEHAKNADGYLMAARDRKLTDEDPVDEE